MEAAANPKEFEKSLMDSLKGIDDSAQLREVSKLLAQYHSLGLTVERWWKYGQPRIDVLKVVGRTPLENFGKLDGLLKDERVAGLKVFVRGIPAVLKKSLDVEVTVNF
jgi:hypothetical protein